MSSTSSKVCDKCLHVFKSAQGLIRHQSRIVPCSGEENFKCDKCEKVFKLKHHFLQHLSRKKSCVKSEVPHKENLQIEKELIDYQTKAKLLIINTDLERKKELIQLQKEKDIAVEEIKKLRKSIGSTAIYIISNEEHIEKNKYKIGKTSDGKAHLQTKYQRYLCGATVLLYLELDSADTTERSILNHFKDKRQKTPTGRLNEWICEDLDIIKSYISEIVA